MTESARVPQPDSGDRIVDAKKAVDQNFLVLGRELYVAFESGKYKGDRVVAFDEYAASKGIDPGRAKRFRRVFKKFSKELGVSFDRMLALGYEKLKTIEPIINRGNRDLWLHRAETMDYSQLLQEVKRYKASKPKRQVVKVSSVEKQSYQPEDATALIARINDEKLKPSADGLTVTTGEVVYVRTIYLIDEQNQVFETALDNIERRTGSTKVGYQLTSALQEFLAHEATRGNLSNDDRMRYYMSILERRYKGKLLWVKDKDVAAKLTQMIADAESAAEDQGSEDGEAD